MTLFSGKSVLRVPREVKLSQSHVLGYYGKGDRRPLLSDPNTTRDRSVSRRILEDLTAIEDSEGVLQFVRRYGFLNAIELTGMMSPSVASGTYSRTLHRIPDEQGLWLGETLQDWFRTVWRLQRSKGVIKRIRAGELKGAARRAEIKSFTEVDLVLLLSETDLRPMLTWSADQQQWRMTIGSIADGDCARFSGALTAAVYFLMREALFDDETVECSVCGEEYAPARQPAGNRANYCPKCRNSPAMWRRLKQAQRHRVDK